MAEVQGFSLSKEINWSLFFQAAINVSWAKSSAASWLPTNHAHRRTRRGLSSANTVSKSIPSSPNSITIILCTDRYCTYILYTILHLNQISNRFFKIVYRPPTGFGVTPLTLDHGPTIGKLSKFLMENLVWSIAA